MRQPQTHAAYLKTRRSRRKQTYKLNDAQMQQLEAVEKCQLCGLSGTQVKCLHIDHCHKTGHVRGVLCGGCNTSIGHIERLMEKKLLQDAIAWVERWNE